VPTDIESNAAEIGLAVRNHDKPWQQLDMDWRRLSCPYAAGREEQIQWESELESKAKY
jgi:hypothetical protein